MSDYTRLCARLRELSDAVTRGEAGMREFDMRIPAEPARDADFVLKDAADVIEQQAYDLAGRDALIEQQAERIAELEKSAVRFLWINPLNPVEGAAMPMIPESWRYAFVATDRGLTFGYHDNGPFVAWDAVKDQAARIAELESAEEESDAVRMGMAKLLTGVANALRGDPPELTCWSWHDLPERAAAAINAITVMEAAARDSARMVAELEAAARWRPMSECPVDNVPIVITRKGGIVEVDSACMVRCDLAGGDQSALGWLPIPPFEEPKIAVSVVADEPDELTPEDVDELSQSEWERDK